MSRKARMGGAAVLALACCAAFPAVAGASRVGRELLGSPTAIDTIRIIDDTGLVPDRLEVTGARSTGVTVTSTPPTPIAANPGCTQTNPFTVSCPGGGSLARVRAELAGEGDVITDRVDFRTELLGGDGIDRLTGGSGANFVDGGSGNDTVDGGEGDDAVHGESTLRGVEPGVDIIRGGPGADTLFANDGVGDSVIECQPAVRQEPQGESAQIDLLDPEPIRCRSVSRAAKDQHPTVQVRAGTVRVRRGRAAVRLRCPRGAPGGRCVGTVAIVKGRRSIARRRYRLRTGRSRTVRLRLGRLVRGRAEIRTSERDTRGMPETTKTTIVLRA